VGVKHKFEHGFKSQILSVRVMNGVMIGYPIRTNPRFSFTARIRNVNVVNTRSRVRSYTSQCSDQLKHVKRVGKGVWPDTVQASVKMVNIKIAQPNRGITLSLQFLGHRLLLL